MPANLAVFSWGYLLPGLYLSLDAGGLTATMLPEAFLQFVYRGVLAGVGLGRYDT